MGWLLAQVDTGTGVPKQPDELLTWCDAVYATVRQLAKLIESTATTLTDAQLDTLEAVTRPLTEPHTAVLRARLPEGAAVRLTPREHDVLTLLCKGLTAAAMARRLGLSPRTVTKHQENLYRKIGARDRVAAVLFAHNHGIVTAD